MFSPFSNIRDFQISRINFAYIYGSLPVLPFISDLVSVLYHNHM